jgi:AcrR family transcriptional regulator
MNWSGSPPGDVEVAQPQPRRSQAIRRAEAREAILEAAILLMGEEGPEAVTLAEVGRRAGYSSGLAAHYFRRKDALLCAMTERVYERVRGAMASRFAAAPGLEGLMAAIRYILSYANARPHEAMALQHLIGESLKNPAVSDTLSAVALLNRQMIADQMKAAQALGDVRPDLDPATESMLLVGGVRGLLQIWLSKPDAFDLATCGRAFEEMARERLAPRRTA